MVLCFSKHNTQTVKNAIHTVYGPSEGQQELPAVKAKPKACVGWAAALAAGATAAAAAAASLKLNLLGCRGDKMAK